MTARIRRGGLAAAGLAMVVALSACEFRTEEKIVVNDDGSGTIAVTVLADREFREQIAQFANSFTLDSGDETATTLDPDALFDVSSPDFTVPPGFEAENIDDGDFQGFVVHGTFDSPEDLAAKLAEANTAGSSDTGASMNDTLAGLTLERDGDGFRFSVDLEGQSIADANDSGLTTGDVDLSDSFKFRIQVTLPGHIAQSNADFLADDSTAVWTIDFANPNRTLEARSEPGAGDGQSSNPGARDGDGNPAAEPITESAAGTSEVDSSGDGGRGGGDDGSSTGLIVGVGAGVVALGGISSFVLIRRKKHHAQAAAALSAGSAFPQGSASPPGAAPPATPPSWYPDPAHRHQLRYHDGTRWTAHVSDAGAQGTDPI